MRVLLGIVLVVAFLLLCSVRIRATYREFFSLKLSYLFFSYTVFPQKEKKTARKKDAPEKADTEKARREHFQAGLPGKGASGFLAAATGLGEGCEHRTAKDSTTCAGAAFVRQCCGRNGRCSGYGDHVWADLFGRLSGGCGSGRIDALPPI